MRQRFSYEDKQITERLGHSRPIKWQVVLFLLLDSYYQADF
jgi:hypothetical protein